MKVKHRFRNLPQEGWISSKLRDFLVSWPSMLQGTAATTKCLSLLKPAALESTQADPEESIELSVEQIGEQVKAELLAGVKSLSPQAFENLVVRLICDMGYGGSRKDAGEAVGGAGDGGIDGVIREDKLGLDLIYLQAKRWEGTVGRPLVQGFVGALHGKNARRGVMITTSTFTYEASSYAESCTDRIILIDGSRLVDLMFEYNIGVSIKTTYELKEVNLTFFEQFA